MRFKIRLADKSDIPFLGEVERSASIAFHTLLDYQPSDRVVPSELLMEMARAGKLWVAVNDQEKPVGFIGCKEMSNFLYIHEISVSHQFQKQGIGRYLMLTAIKYASETGYPAIGLTTRRDAAWNMPFYKSLGFVEVTNAKEWPDLFTQLQKEIADGAAPRIRCAMIRSCMS